MTHPAPAAADEDTVLTEGGLTIRPSALEALYHALIAIRYRARKVDGEEHTCTTCGVCQEIADEALTAADGDDP